MNRFVSNLVLGFFVLALMAVYGFAKQPTVFSMMTGKSQTTTGDNQATASVEKQQRIILPNGTTVLASVAETDAERSQGLAGVAQLNQDSGMLLVFAQSGTYPIWMKGMKVPLDIVWLDDQGKVVQVASRVPVPITDDTKNLPVYTNQQPAKYVLELAAGEAEVAGISQGSQLTLS